MFAQNVQKHNWFTDATPITGLTNHYKRSQSFCGIGFLLKRISSKMHTILQLPRAGISETGMETTNCDNRNLLSKISTKTLARTCHFYPFLLLESLPSWTILDGNTPWVWISPWLGQTLFAERGYGPEAPTATKNIGEVWMDSPPKFNSSPLTFLWLENYIVSFWEGNF